MNLDTFKYERVQEQIFCYERNVTTSFGHMLAKAIEAKRLSPTAWALSVDGVSNGHAFNMIADRRPPQLDLVEHWADSLDLTGDQRQDFLEAAHLAHCPPSIQEAFIDMKRRIRLFDERLAKLEDPRRVAESPEEFQP